MTRPLLTGIDPAKLRQLQARAKRRRASVRLTSAIARDPQTGTIRRGRVEREAFGIRLYLPKFLPSPNQWHWAPWWQKSRIKAAWVEVIRVTAIDNSAAGTRLAALSTPAGALGWMAPPPPVRARVDITRQVATAQKLIRDDDNLSFAAKPLLDCIVQAGFLRGDSREEIDRHYDQVVSPDGLDWTVIAITVPEDQRC
jgi:hypothetical protein